MDHEHGDLVKKPGQFLPDISDKDFMAQFEQETKKSDKEQMLIEQRLREIEMEKRKREAALKEHKSTSAETNKEMVKKGLEALGMDRQTKEQSEIEKRKKLFASLKGIIKQ